MMNLNEAVLTGRFTADPLLKENKNGKKYCSFSIAVKRRLPKNATEEQKKNDADFIRCKAWNERAELIAKDGKKGARILVKVEYHQNKFEKDGKLHDTTELWVNHFEFMTDGKKGENAEAEAASEAPAAPAAPVNDPNVPL